MMRIVIKVTERLFSVLSEKEVSHTLSGLRAQPASRCSVCRSRVHTDKTQVSSSLRDAVCGPFPSPCLPTKPVAVPQHVPSSLCLTCSFPRFPQDWLPPSVQTSRWYRLRSIPRTVALIQIPHHRLHVQPFTALESSSHYRPLTLGFYSLSPLWSGSPILLPLHL